MHRKQPLVVMSSPDEEDDDILVVPPSPPGLTPSNLSQVPAGGFFHQSPPQNTRTPVLVVGGPREPPLPSLVEGEGVQSSIRNGLLRNPDTTLAQLNTEQANEESHESNDEDNSSLLDEGSSGQLSGRSTPGDDVIEIDVTSDENSNQEDSRPSSPVPPPDTPQNPTLDTVPPPDSPQNPALITFPLPENPQNPTVDSIPPPDSSQNSTRDPTGVVIPSTTAQPLPSADNVEQVPTTGAIELSASNNQDTLPQPGPSHVNIEAEGTQHPAAQVVQVLRTNLDSPGDFRSPKRRRVEVTAPPETTSTASAAIDDEDDDDGNCCPICFEDWTTSGSHRLTSLRCGHLFGQSCIEKWLKGQGGKCPHCNAKAKRQDIRVLFTKSIKAIDTTERDRALQELEKEREARRKLEMESAQCRLQYQLATEECNRLKAELDRVRQTVQSLRSQSSSSFSVPLSQATSSQSGIRLEGQFVLDKTIKIWDAGNCRVMANCTSLGTLIVSQPSSSPLFPGFGIKKISTMDFKTSQFLTIHSKAIRDVCFHPTVDDGILLSASLDKTIKMTNVISNAVIQNYETPAPVWSCVWNADDRNYFYAGLMNGTVIEYDIRNTSEHLQELNKEGHRSPVVSLQYIPRDPQAVFRPGGIVVGQLAQVSFYEKKPDDQYRPHMLALDGSLSSLCFEPTTRSLLATFKPNTKYPTTRHLMCEMASASLSVDPTVSHNVCTCNVIQTFHGGRTHTMLSKSALFPHPADNNRLLVCAGEEATSSVHMWDCGTGTMVQRLPTGGVVVDVCALQTNQQNYLAVLTEKQLKVHRWT